MTARLIAPVWPNQLWFPQLLACLVDHPIPLPHITDIVSGPEGRNHPLGEGGHLPLAAWPVSGDRVHHRDFRNESRRSSGSHGDLQQNQPITTPGDSGCIGALRKADPLSAPVRKVLEFFCERFYAGKQYPTINTLRSAISMTHEEVDGVQTGQHPMVSHFLKGVFNLRPPALRYTTMWDVDTVLDYLNDLPDNIYLDLQQLSHKLTMLLALTNTDRWLGSCRLGSFQPYLSGEWCNVCYSWSHKDKGEWPSLGGILSSLSREPEALPSADTQSL